MKKNKKINDFLGYLESKWINENPDSIAKSSILILNSLDDSINLAEQELDNGKDKKEIVLYIMSSLFENVISKSLPAYVVPFEKLIRVFLIKIVLSVMIDFIVNKYNQGSWNWKRKDSYEK